MRSERVEAPRRAFGLGNMRRFDPRQATPSQAVEANGKVRQVKRLGWFAVVRKKNGLLLGGVRKHEAGPFSEKSMAESWRRQAVEVNRGAGRRPTSSTVVKRFTGKRFVA